VTNSFGAASGIVSDITSGAIRQGVGVLVKERSRISWAGVASGGIQSTAVAGFTGAFTSSVSSQQLASSGTTRIDGVLSPEEEALLNAQLTSISDEERAQNDAMYEALVDLMSETKSKGGFVNDDLGFNAEEIFADDGLDLNLELIGPYEKAARELVEKHGSGIFGLKSNDSDTLIKSGRDRDATNEILNNFDFRNGNLEELPPLRFDSYRVDIGYYSGRKSINKSDLAFGAISVPKDHIAALGFVAKSNGLLGKQAQLEAEQDYEVLKGIISNINNNTKVSPEDRNGAADIAFALISNIVKNNADSTIGRLAGSVMTNKYISKSMSLEPKFSNSLLVSGGAFTSASFGKVISGIGEAREKGVNYTVQNFVLDSVLGSSIDVE
jgi:hypothetical protein